jgi:hypothetical protein
MLAYKTERYKEEIGRLWVYLWRFFFVFLSSLQTSKQSRPVYRPNGFFQEDASVFTLAVSFTEAILEELSNFRCTSKGIAWRFVVLIRFSVCKERFK